MNDVDSDVNHDKKEKIYGYFQLVLAILFIAVAFVLSRYLAALETRPEPGRGAGQRELLVDTIQVTPGTYRLRFTAFGTVQVRAMADLVPQVSGRVTDIDENAFPGGRFTAETVLFSIDKTDFRLRVEQAKAELARAETRLKLQQSSSEAAESEWRQLHPKKPVPPLVAEKPQLAQAQAELAAARAALEIARLNLYRTDFKLPYAGRITGFNLEKGQYAVAGQPYGQAYRSTSLEIDLPLEKEQLEWLVEAEDPVIVVTGTEVSDADESAVEYKAYVKRISGTVDPRTRLARVVLGLQEVLPDVVPGIFIKVEIAGPVRDRVWVLPVNALQENRTIWTVTPENKLNRLQLKIIQITQDRVIAESDGRDISVVRGSIPEAVEDMQVRVVERGENRMETDDR